MYKLVLELNFTLKVSGGLSCYLFIDHWHINYMLKILFLGYELKELVTSESLKDGGMVVKKAIMAGKIPMRTLSLLSSIRFLRFFTKSLRSSSVTWI